jgi:N-methylhydantoinase A
VRSVSGVRVGVDVGGTFTDFAVASGDGLQIFKVSSTPGDPAEAVLEGLRRSGIGSDGTVVHGSTVATNAVLERKGARTVLVTTAGFRDVLEIARQNRPALYDIEPRKPAPLIERELRLEVDERVGADGAVRRPLDRDSLDRLTEQVRELNPESAAVCLLFSFLRPSHERSVRAALRRAGLRWISISSEVLPEHREYERTSTTVVDAYVAPVMGRYIRRLEKAAPGQLWIVQSGGGVLRSSEAAAAPVQSVLSGPAAGVVGARAVAAASGFDHIVTLDMGGTSTDVAICPGEPLRRTDASVGGLPVAIPMTDIHTVGAGGGSIASRDEAGGLRVGPRSAGAQPGPAAYGRGGLEPTVTDANVVLGRLNSDAALADDVALDASAAAAAIDRLAVQPNPSASARLRAAAGVVAVADAHMERALRVITLERGYDPRDFTLVAFGGAGPLHGCALAERLEIDRVLVPRFPGVLSALGALSGEHVREYSTTLLRPATARSVRALTAAYRRLERNARRDFTGAGRPRLRRMLDLRYVGQSYELTVPLRGRSIAGAVRAFHQRHQERYAHSRPDAGVEIVVARLIASVEQPAIPDVRPHSRGRPKSRPVQVVDDGESKTARMFRRDELPEGFRARGPLLVVQEDATTWAPPGWRVQVDEHAALVLERI